MEIGPNTILTGVAAPSFLVYCGLHFIINANAIGGKLETRPGPNDCLLMALVRTEI